MQRAVPWIVATLACLPLSGCEDPPPPPPPPLPVQVTEVLQRDEAIYIESIAQTRGSVEVQVRARVEGFVETVDFEEGTYVKAGDLLYTIDHKPLDASLAQAKGQLAAAEAEHVRTKQDVLLYEPLVKQNAISRQEYETAVALERASQAGVEAALAVVQQAEFDLSYTKIVAPIDGLVGESEVDPGALVGRGDNTLLTTVSLIDPITVAFSVSEADYLRYAKRDRADGIPAGTRHEVPPVQLVLGDRSEYQHPGELVFADRIVDPTTGTLLLKAEFPNPERLIRPGQYGRIRMIVDERKGALLVPQRAVRELQATFSVATVDGENKIGLRTVMPGERVGSLWVIESGLAPGERVVVEGLQKVREGMTVAPTVVPIEGPASAPAATPAPTPGAAPPEKPAEEKVPEKDAAPPTGAAPDAGK